MSNKKPKPQSRKEKKQSKKKNNLFQKRKEKKEAFKKKRMARPPLKRYLYDIGRFIRRSIMLLLLLASIAFLSVFYIYKTQFEDKVSESIREGYEIAATINEDDFRVLDPTVMKDENGNVVKTFTERNFKYLDLSEDDELFEKVSDVVTAIEDERFYRHEGFDYLGVGVAVINHYVMGQDLRGASTLTAQLVKNTYLSPEQTLERKIVEAVIAQELEDKFTKREILEFYVNDAYYANGNYGMETAAHYYFSKPTKELTHGEVATLISIPNNPTIYNPITNPENTMKRRNLTLRLMGEQGKLPADAVKLEQDKELNLDVTVTKINNETSDWAQSLAMTSAVEEMMRYEGFQFKYWFDTEQEREDYKQQYNDVYYRHLENIRRGGFVIETSINSELQQKLQSTIDRNMSQFTRIDNDGYLEKQAPAVVIDNRTNEVVAIVGGRSQENPGTFNRAYQAAKQPGSAIKPFLSYAPAIESGLATGTLREDKAIQDGPKNWYNSYRGNMTLRTALEQSVNTIAYNLYQEVGLTYARNKLVDMEFSNLSPKDIYPTMAVGGWTYGTNPLELASAFNTLSNDGLYYRPNNLRKISSNYRDEVYYDRANHQPKRIYDSGVSYVTTNMMQTTISNGLNKGYSFGYEFEAGKSGSTDHYKEQWFVGGTPYYSMSIYIGDNNPKPQNNRIISPVLQNIYTSFMGDVHRGLEVVDFNRPQSVVQDGNNYWVRTERDVDPQDTRKLEEKNRVEALHQKQNARLDELSYRIVHNLTLNQAIAREKVAEAQIQQLEAYDLNGSKDLSEAQAIHDEAQEAVGRVVRTVEKNRLSSRLSRAWNVVVSQRNSIIAAEKAEEERLKREEAERERQIKLEEERIKREEEERERAILEEQQRREEEMRADELEEGTTEVEFEFGETDNEAEETEDNIEEIE